MTSDLKLTSQIIWKKWYVTQSIQDRDKRIQNRAVSILLPDYKLRDTLKIANIGTSYDRRESLSLKLFYENSHTNDHKLASFASTKV